jgi:type I restriction enzyme S subunit
MTADLKPYPTMKDSGVPWLGEMPAHWEVRRNGRLFAQRNETGFAGLPILEVSLRTGVRVRDFENSDRKQVMTDRDKYKRAAKGDLAYNMMRMWQGAVGIAPVDGLVSPAYVVARPLPEAHGRYFSYLFRTDAYMNEVDKYSRGIVKDRNRLYWDDFKQMPSAFPPPEEQRSIAAFLDGNGRVINRAIRAKQKLIKLLEEQKQAIIHRAVTRGLDPNVRLKPSGVEWLGDVPEHWEVVRLKEVTSAIEQGWSPQCDAQSASDDQWGILKVGCVNRDAFDESQNKKLPAALEPMPALEVRDGDILVSRANTRELLGLAAVAINPRPKLMLCDKLFRLRPRNARADARFLVYAIRQRTSRAQIESSTNGASDSMQNIGQGVIRNLQLSMPPLEEQRQILASLEAQTSSLADGVSRAQREISLLREYRTRLIADVVTGKLDVRGVEVPAHVASDETEEIDTGENDGDDSEDVMAEDEPEHEIEHEPPR